MERNKARVRPPEAVDVVHATGLIAALSVLALRRDAIEHAGWLAVLDLGLLAAVLGVALGPAGRVCPEKAATWRLALSVVLVVLLFGQMAALTPAVNDRRYDALFLAWDRDYLGFVPFETLAFMVHPRLSDLLAAVYFSFYAIPIAFFVVLYRRRMFAEIRKATASVVAGFYLSFAGNAMFPAASPFRELDPPAPLPGGEVFHLVHRLVDRHEVHELSAFPSGHILVSAIVVAYCARWTRGVLAVFLVWTGLLWMGTLYLGYHYLVDTLAALPLVPLAMLIGEFLDRVLSRQAAAFGGSRSDPEGRS